jgi:hypothetical protein
MQTARPLSSYPRAHRCSRRRAWPSAGFWPSYSGTTRAGYATDLRAWFGWCAEAKLEIFGVRRAHIELFARWMEEARHLARATIGRRLSTVVGFYRFSVIDGYITESPAEHIRRPKIDTESTTLGLDRMELGAFLAHAAAAGPWITPWRACSGCSACGSPKPAPLAPIVHEISGVRRDRFPGS